MAAITYLYAPTYGVERYAYNGGDGGAVETNDNLLITLWGIEEKDPIEFGELIVPAYATENPDITTSAELAPAYEQAMKSRTSSRFLIGLLPKYTILMAVLNPPQEYRQQMVDAVVYTGGDVTDLDNFTVKKSLQCNYVWRLEAINNSAIGQNVDLPGADTLSASYSSYLDLGVGVPPTIPTSAPRAFLKTNGADGEAPEFFDRSTPDGVKEMIAAVNKGDFYIGMFLLANIFQTGSYVNIVYPHSAARG